MHHRTRLLGKDQSMKISIKDLTAEYQQLETVVRFELQDCVYRKNEEPRRQKLPDEKYHCRFTSGRPASPRNGNNDARFSSVPHRRHDHIDFEMKLQATREASNPAQRHRRQCRQWLLNTHWWTVWSRFHAKQIWWTPTQRMRVLLRNRKPWCRRMEKDLETFVKTFQKS